MKISLQQIFNPIKVLSEYSVGFSFLAYVTGFIITNVSLLHTYGFYDADFFRSRYLLTGTLFLIIATILAFLFLVPEYIIASRSRGKTAKIWPLIGWINFIASLALLPFIYPLLPQYLGGGREVGITYVLSGPSAKFAPSNCADGEFRINSLVFATNDKLFIRSSYGGVMQISINDVGAIYYSPVPEKTSDIKDMCLMFPPNGGLP